MPWLVTAIGRKIFFEFLSHTFLCLSKEKYAKERTPRGGVGRSWFRGASYPQPSVRRTPLSCGVSGAAVIHDGLKLAARSLL